MDVTPLPDKAYLVFVASSFLPFLEPIKNNLATVVKEKYFYIACEDLEEQIHYLKLKIPHDFPLNKKGYDFEVSIPHSVILYFCSAQKKDLNKIHGFHSAPEGADSTPD